MRTFAKSQIRYSKSQRMGIFAFIGIIILFQLLYFFLNKDKQNSEPIAVPDQVYAMDQGLEKDENDNAKNEIIYQNFDPNVLSSTEWQDLGFSEKQVNTILKYKYSLGGHFSSKEEIKNCFVISERKYRELEPFIEFGTRNTKKNSDNYMDSNSYSKSAKTKIHYVKFNPNNYTQVEWEKIGFSEKQAQTILKYKQRLGGKFTSIEQIRECFVISEEKFKEMKPYIVLPIPEKKPKGTIEVLEEKPESKGDGTIEILENEEGN